MLSSSYCGSVIWKSENGIKGTPRGIIPNGNGGLSELLWQLELKQRPGTGEMPHLPGLGQSRLASGGEPAFYAIPLLLISVLRAHADVN